MEAGGGRELEESRAIFVATHRWKSRGARRAARRMRGRGRTRRRDTGGCAGLLPLIKLNCLSGWASLITWPLCPARRASWYLLLARSYLLPAAESARNTRPRASPIYFGPGPCDLGAWRERGFIECVGIYIHFGSGFSSALGRGVGAVLLVLLLTLD